MVKYNQSGNKVFMFFGDLKEKLEARTYKVDFNPEIGFFLEETENLHYEGKIYGDALMTSERIIKTYNSRSKSTGVLLSGEKGNGKTVLVKLISSHLRKLGVPTLIISEPWFGEKFIKFVSDINQPCMVIFDEFEKIYDMKKQQTLLTMLDGVYSGENKRLFLLTANDKNQIESHFFNRPGRVYYHIEYNALSADLIREISEENLKNKDLISSILKVSETVTFSFDLLMALIEECNRYDCSVQNALHYLNIKPVYTYQEQYKISIELNGKLQDTTKWTDRPYINGSPLMQTGNFVFAHNKTDNRFDQVTYNKLFAVEGDDPYFEPEDFEDDDGEDKSENTVEFCVINQDNLNSMESNEYLYRSTTNLGNEFVVKLVKKSKNNFHYDKLFKFIS